MAKLEDIRVGARVSGVVSDGVVAVKAVEWFGSYALALTYKTEAGGLGETMLYRDMEPQLTLVSDSQWTFDADPDKLKLVSEAYRINLAHLFDPYLAVRTSSVDPLPHQISAVYKDMLPKMPLRYVLADDPGAGKTIMAGLLIKEMLARGDLKRCLIVCPGNLVEQWQDELFRKFGLKFTILTNDLLEASVTRNAFKENDLCIARLDKLSRSEDVQKLLQDATWDLVVVDEAHKMSATVFGGEVKYTKRYQLGQLLGETTENLLLMTATPHNGKPEDFQLFMALVDRDRFEGARHRKPKKDARANQPSLFPEGFTESAMRLPDDSRKPGFDVSDVMRRLVKEELLRFDGRPLFPERRAYTVTYTLSPAEADLYQMVTDYVTEEFNRADRLDGKRKSSVGFALTVLQRRLASSPEAIYQSLRRRRERLESRLLEMRDAVNRTGGYSMVCPVIDEDYDDDDWTEEERERIEDEVIDTASASATAAELEAEIVTLKNLERKANEVRMSGEDRKWDELSRLLQDNSDMFGEDGRREKLIVFTEHKDTLEYLATKIRNLLGNRDAVLTIKGGMHRDARHKAEEMFKQDKDVRILVATDAAGEGINLQRAHLMVNYDLPWNPNRIEQRFGRVHRIGQTEVCHLWNLVAKETREGEVFDRLFKKLEEERAALGGRVFDILGRVTFEDRPLRDLLVEAIRYGALPEVRDRLNQVVDSSLDGDALRRLLEDYALTADVMDVRSVMRIKEDMERMEARKLEPHFIEAFFVEAMKHLGGRIAEREKGRYEVIETPFAVRSQDMRIGAAEPVLRSYERICFEKERMVLPGSMNADLVCPGHPLLDATVSVILERGAGTMRQGAVLVDDDETADAPRMLFYVESAIRDGTVQPDGAKKTISRHVHFVEIDYDGNAINAGYAPYLDYRAPTKAEWDAAERMFVDELGWLESDPDKLATGYAIQNIIPDHIREVRSRTLAHVEKVQKAVDTRLRAEINYWDFRAGELADREHAGKKNARLNSKQAERRANELAERLARRMEQLKRQKQLSPMPPRIVGGALVIPSAMLHAKAAPDANGASADAEAKRKIELAAMDAVFAIEHELGYDPHDVSLVRGKGYDIESTVPEGRRSGSEPVLRMIEVKGRIAGADSVTLSKNEILAALNVEDSGGCWLLAIVEVDGATTHTTYLRRPALTAPSFAETNRSFNIGRLVESAEVVLERTDTWQ